MRIDKATAIRVVMAGRYIAETYLSVIAPPGRNLLFRRRPCFAEAICPAERGLFPGHCPSEPYTLVITGYAQRWGVTHP